MPIIIEGKGGVATPISRLEQTQGDFRLWSIEFSGRYRRMRGEEFPDDLISLGKGSSTRSEEMVKLWLNGHPAGERRWDFLNPVHKAGSVLDEIDQLYPYLGEYIDRLAAALELGRRKVPEGVIQVNAFQENRSNLPTAIRLGNGNCIVLGRRHVLSVSESSRTEYAELGYFLGAKTNRTGLWRLKEPNHYALVRAQRLEVNFETLFLPVLCRSSYQAGRDSNRF